VKIATWNVNSLKARLPHLLQWLADSKPDIVALQETKTQDVDFPHEAIRDAGYEVIYRGQKSYNGVATLSRDIWQSDVALHDALPEFDDPQKRLLVSRHNGIHVVNIYVPNGAALNSDKYLYKLQWLRHLHAFIADLLKTGEPLLILGDFNIAPEDRDVHDPAAWTGQVLVSEAEREHYRKLIDIGLHDCLRLVAESAGIYSWWDYRAASFRRNLGLRIDLILANDQMASRCRDCGVDKIPRQWERPSDHAPVLAEFV
jgi:exodeoxyribonuclease-3